MALCSTYPYNSIFLFVVTKLWGLGCAESERALSEVCVQRAQICILFDLYQVSSIIGSEILCGVHD